MPELPDVQVFKEYFDATSLKKEITGVKTSDKSLLEGISGKSLRERLVGTSFSGTQRHGKYLFARLAEGDFLVLHFGMTGFLRAYRNEDKATEHTALLLRFTDGYHLAYDCKRRLGLISMADSVEEFIRKKDLGPDAGNLCRDREAFVARLRGHHGAIKPLLMNQKVMAGIGNIYADEILYRAGMHPKKKADELADDERRTLAVKACQIFATAIAKRAGEKGWPQGWLLPRRKAGRACPRCSGKIKRITISGRGTYFCPEHQG